MQTLTIPYLVDNPEVGYVQARWTFANPDESYLTKVILLQKSFTSSEDTDNELRNTKLDAS